MLVINYQALDQLLRIVQVLSVDNVINVGRDILSLLVGDLVSGSKGLGVGICDVCCPRGNAFSLLVSYLVFHGIWGSISRPPGL